MNTFCLFQILLLPCKMIAGKVENMDEKALHTLEYDKIIEKLAGFASSAPAKELCLGLLPMTDPEKIALAQKQTNDALTRLFRKGSISFGNVVNVLPMTKRLEIGSCLSAPELLSVAKLLENTANVKKYGSKERAEEADDSLSFMFNELSPISSASLEIRRCILSEDEISDDASPALRSLRRDLKRLNDKIHTELTRIIATSATSGVLQDSIVTTRNGRYCVPVKSEQRANLPGIVHDQSSTGSTIFIEPASIVALNNEIAQTEAKEAAEIQKILADLSEMLAGYIPEIISDYEIMKMLDFIFAKGHLAMEMNASMPIYNTEGIIDIKKARHPLIEKKKVVPIDIKIGEDYRLLIITGPNTGGKTVTLKTTGLLTLMGQAGLHIPAADRSRLSIFTNVYADIGDEQSIEQSLSTFSSHMVNVVSFMDKADENSLVLFDELGAGTDPTEGAALAISILSDLKERGITAVATTHYSELKIYALRTPGVENASCEFNVDTLSPTYRLLIGIPGKSNAFAISKKLGLPDRIIEKAKNELSAQDESFEDVISDLEEKRRKIEEEQDKLEKTQKELTILKEELSKGKAELAKRKSDLIRNSSEEARNILQNAKDYADRTIREFNKAKSGNASIKELEQKREKLRKKIDNYGNNAAKSQKLHKGHLKASDIKPGDSVHVISLDLKATVSTLPDAKGDLYVTAGILRTKVNISDLEKANEPQEKFTFQRERTGTGDLKFAKSSQASYEINLLGRTVDEAIPELEKFLDDAMIAHIPEVRIVHGKGTGALRDGIHKYLKKQKHIKAFRLGEFGEGDAGVTIATFR